MRIAALGAHPDDIEIYLGGTMLAWRAMGADLHIVVATDGARGGPGDPAKLAALRAAEAEAGAAVLGATLHMLGMADGALDAEAALVARLATLLARIGADLVVTHAPNDYHADHRALAAAARQAAGFRHPLLHVDTLMGTGFLPTHYVDVSAHFGTKCEAIRCHQSQEPERFVDKCRLQNRFRAAQCGHDDGHAEAFRFEPVFPFADIRDLLPPAPSLAPVKPREKG